MAQIERSGWTGEHSKLFAEHEDTIRGHVRYQVTRHNLLNTLGEFLAEPRRVADVGGGKGQDAKWLARQKPGHQLYLIEPDRQSAGEAMQGNNGLIQIIPGDSRTALDYYGPEAFDLVLSHGVLQYQKDPAKELADLARLVKPGGYLSLLNAGLLGKLNRYQSRGELAKVDQLRLTGRFSNNLGLSSVALLPKDMQSMIESAALETINWFGVRIFSDDDSRSLEEVPAFHRNRMLDMEIRASSDPVLRPSGQMLHFIVRKSHEQ